MRYLSIGWALFGLILWGPLQAQDTHSGSGFEDVTALTALVPPSPKSGFNYPYLLKRPTVLTSAAPIRLVVETNNTGRASDDFGMHLKAARQATERGVGEFAADRLELPLLIPVFPRPGSDDLIYTHALDSDSLDIPSGPMRRLDLQLIAMIDDAIRRLKTEGIEVDERVLMIGFSASATFANRFSMIHPNRIAALSIGGFNATLILPVEKINGIELPYPLGISDFETRFDKSFDRDKWLAIPQFAFMGENDNNDAVKFDDAYSEEQRQKIYEVMGEAMDARWLFIQQVYTESGAEFRATTYHGIGHGTNEDINIDMSNFLVENSSVEGE